MDSDTSVSVNDGDVVRLAVQQPSVGESPTLALTQYQRGLIVSGPSSNLK